LCSEFYPKGMENIENGDKLLFAWDDAVAQLVMALRYKTEGRGFDFR